MQPLNLLSHQSETTAGSSSGVRRPCPILCRDPLPIQERAQLYFLALVAAQFAPTTAATTAGDVCTTAANQSRHFIQPVSTERLRGLFQTLGPSSQSRCAISSPTASLSRFFRCSLIWSFPAAPPPSVRPSNRPPPPQRHPSGVPARARPSCAALLEPLPLAESARGALSSRSRAAALVPLAS